MKLNTFTVGIVILCSCFLSGQTLSDESEYGARVIRSARYIDMNTDRAYERTFREIEILSEAGYSEADFLYYIDRSARSLVNLEAYTLLPDGTRIDVPESLIRHETLIRSDDEFVEYLQFTYPGVVVGSRIILDIEWRWKEAFSSFWWEIQEEIPVKIQTLEFKVIQNFRPQFGHYAYRSFSEYCSEKTVESKPKFKTMRMECKDIPAWDPDTAEFSENADRIRMLHFWDSSFFRTHLVNNQRQLGYIYKYLNTISDTLDSKIDNCHKKIADSVEDTSNLVLIWDAILASVHELDGGIGACETLFNHSKVNYFNKVAIARKLLSRFDFNSRIILAADRRKFTFNRKIPEWIGEMSKQIIAVSIQADDGSYSEVMFDLDCKTCSPGVVPFQYTSETVNAFKLNSRGVQPTPTTIPPLLASKNLERRIFKLDLTAEDPLLTASVEFFGQTEIQRRDLAIEVSTKNFQDIVKQLALIRGNVISFESTDPEDRKQPFVLNFAIEPDGYIQKIDKDQWVVLPVPSISNALADSKSFNMLRHYPHSVLVELHVLLPPDLKPGQLPEYQKYTSTHMRSLRRWSYNSEDHSVLQEAFFQIFKAFPKDKAEAEDIWEQAISIGWGQEGLILEKVQ